MKWNIRKEGIDNYFLEYKDKMLPFKSNVGLVNDLQGSIKKARLRMVKELSEMGMSVNDLTKITSADGKTTYDNSNKQFIEESYINEENQKVLEDIMKKIDNIIVSVFRRFFAKISRRNCLQRDTFSITPAPLYTEHPAQKTKIPLAISST